MSDHVPGDERDVARAAAGWTGATDPKWANPAHPRGFYAVPRPSFRPAPRDAQLAAADALLAARAAR